MLNCLFFRIFSSVSFVSLYQTKAQRSGFCLELRSKGAERGMPSPAGRYTRSGLCDEVVGVGCCPQTAFGGQPGHRRLAKCDAGSFVGTSSISLAPPQAAGLVHSAAPPLKIAIALLDCDFVFFAHVGATWAFAPLLRIHRSRGKSRTQRRHSPHGALRVLDTPAGSIGTIFSVVGRSAPTALFRQMRRSPLLFRNDTKIPVCLRVSTLFRI